MIGRITRCGVLVTAMFVLAGCQSVPQDEYEEALAENAELRDRLASAQANLEQSEEDKEQLLRQTQDLAAQIDRTQTVSQQQPSAPPGATLRGGDVVLTVAGDVLFDSGKATLKSSGRRELDRIARMILTQYPNNTIRVEGYTDTDPIRRSRWKTNERLSAERALAVESYLVARGVDKDRIYAAAMGPANPKSNKAASRRVEIVILDQ
jgi:outer membrane protein OmpA-like peptidoglycan-associated protein